MRMGRKLGDMRILMTPEIQMLLIVLSSGEVSLSQLLSGVCS